VESKLLTTTKFKQMWLMRDSLKINLQNLSYRTQKDVQPQPNIKKSLAQICYSTRKFPLKFLKKITPLGRNWVLISNKNEANVASEKYIKNQ
jgi:hypothetical protein